MKQWNDEKELSKPDLTIEKEKERSTPKLTSQFLSFLSTDGTIRKKGQTNIEDTPKKDNRLASPFVSIICKDIETPARRDSFRQGSFEDFEMGSRMTPYKTSVIKENVNDSRFSFSIEDGLEEEERKPEQNLHQMKANKRSPPILVSDPFFGASLPAQECIEESEEAEESASEITEHQICDLKSVRAEKVDNARVSFELEEQDASDEDSSIQNWQLVQPKYVFGSCHNLSCKEELLEEDHIEEIFSFSDLLMFFSSKNTPSLKEKHEYTSRRNSCILDQIPITETSKEHNLYRQRTFPIDIVKKKRTKFSLLWACDRPRTRDMLAIIQTKKAQVVKEGGSVFL